jgi:cytochrome P450
MSTAAESLPWLPDHVAPDLAWDNLLYGYAGSFDDPFVGASTLHEGPDIIYAKGAYRDMPGWLLTRYDHIEEVFQDPTHFSSAGWAQTRTLFGVDWDQNPLEIDPPAHKGYRQILQPSFQPSAINQLESIVRQTACELIDKFKGNGGCEFVSEFSALFPSYIFLELMGMPREKLPEFMEWEKDLFRGSSDEIRAAGGRRIIKYMEDYSAERRARPKGDVVSKIVTARLGDRPLDHGEILGMCVLLYVGGLDTVMSSLGWYFRHLANDQTLQSRLKDNPQDIPLAVDEFLRAFGITGTRRRLTCDYEFHGVLMKEGEWVTLPTYLASRDPRQYSDPHTIDIDRKARHLTLATGIHNCLGIHLAKREIKVVLEEFLSRFSNIRIPDGEQAEWHTGVVWGLDRLPLVWDC